MSRQGDPQEECRRIATTVVVRRPVEDVFAYVATPDTWPQWHANSLWVSNAHGQPAGSGDQVTEAFALFNDWSRVVWTVTESLAPERFVVDGLVGGLRGTVSYELSPSSGGTRVDRTVTYAVPSRWRAILDWILIRPRLEMASARALERLRLLLEVGTPAQKTSNAVSLALGENG